MRQRIAIFLLISGIALAGGSCGKSQEPDHSIHLTPQDVSALLGIEGIGEVTSGPDGVTVKTISFCQGDGPEFQARDVVLNIASSSRLVYVISSLQVGSLEVLDLKNGQHAGAIGIRVEKPGDHFLSQLESAIDAARSGTGFSTANLSCDRLAIDSIDYEIRTPNGAVNRVGIDGLTIDQAATDRLGQVSVKAITVGDLAAGKGLRATKVDRACIDQALATLVFSRLAGMPTRPLAAPLVLPELSTRILPFDHFEVEQANLDFGVIPGAQPGVGQVTSLQMDVQRGKDGAFAGLTGKVDFSLASSAVPDAWRSLVPPGIGQAIAGSANVNLALDAGQSDEHFGVTLHLPGLLTLSADGVTRGLPQLLQVLLTQKMLPGRLVTVSRLSLAGQEEGLVHFLLGSHPHLPRWGIKRLIVYYMNRAIPQWSDDQSGQGLDAFLQDPRDATITFQAQGFLDFGQFVNLVRAGQSTPLVKVSVRFN